MNQKVAYEMVFAILQQFFRDGIVHKTANYFERYIECFLLGYTFRITLTMKAVTRKR